MEEEVYIVDELENRITVEAGNYRHKCDNLMSECKFDPNYFDNFIDGPLYEEFVKTIYERIHKLNALEINKYLTISCNQFESYLPSKRITQIYDKYWSNYWYPNTIPGEMEDYAKDYINHVIAAYNKHFHKYKAFTEQILSDIRNSASQSSNFDTNNVSGKTEGNIFSDFLNTALTDLLLPKKKVRSDDEINNYVFRWLDREVTLNEWLEYRDINIIDAVNDFNFTDEDKEEISQHMFHLYNELANNIFKNRYEKSFERISSIADKLSVAHRDLALIKDLMDGNINDFKATRLQKVFHINNWQKVSLQFEQIVRGLHDSDNNFDIHHPDCYAEAEAINSYRKLLETYILIFDESETEEKETEPQRIVSDDMAKVEFFLNPNFNNFMKFLDPVDKYKGNWSCIGYWGYLAQHFYEVETLIPLHHNIIADVQKKLSIDSHIRHLKYKSDKFICYNANIAQHFLMDNELTIEELFENGNYASDLIYEELPTNFNLTYDELYNQGKDIRLIELHFSFITHISNHYIEKLHQLLKSLPYPGSELEKSVVTVPLSDSSPKQKKTGYIAFKSKKYKHTKSVVTDLMNDLIDAGFIDKATDIKDFRKIFNNQLPTEPICWLGSMTDLAHFVKYMHNEIKAIDDLGKDVWRITSTLFVNSSKTSFDWRKLRTLKPSSKAVELERAANNLK